MKVSQKEIYNYLIEKGLSRNHALGILANIKAESNFNAAAEGDKEKDVFMSYGLFQHYDERRDSLVKFIEEKYENKDWKTNWKAQIDFALQENAGENYKKETFDTPQKASKYFTINFEKPGTDKQAWEKAAEERLNYFGEEYEVNQKLEFKDLQGKEIKIKEVSYLINPQGQVDGKDVIIKTEDYNLHVIGAYGTEKQRNQAYKDFSSQIEGENYSIEDFTQNINEGSISYDPKSEWNEEITDEEFEEIVEEEDIPPGPLQKFKIEKQDEETIESQEKEIIEETEELLQGTKPLPSGVFTDDEGNLWRKGKEGGWQVKYNKATRETGAPTIDEFGQPSFEMKYNYEDDWTTLDKKDPSNAFVFDNEQSFENQLTPFEGDIEQLPKTAEDPQPAAPITNVQKAQQVGSSLLKGAGAVLDSVGGPMGIISYIMGKRGLKEAMKEIQPQARPELSPMFMEHFRQTKELSKKGFHPSEEMKFKKELNKSYQIGLENAVRGSGGQRARFLAQSGVLDAQRSSALLDYAVKDDELQRKNQERYEKMMLFKENFDIQRTEMDRLEDMQRQERNKKAASQFTAAAFTNALSGLRGASFSGIVDSFLGNNKKDGFQLKMPNMPYNFSETNTNQNTGE
tara:strand:- start:273 stop:2156 length:1884 start_codon:yes stop_codon:yes gene_type:complete